jgi:hypothetical protein
MMSSWELETCRAPYNYNKNLKLCVKLVKTYSIEKWRTVRKILKKAKYKFAQGALERKEFNAEFYRKLWKKRTTLEDFVGIQ